MTKSANSGVKTLPSGWAPTRKMAIEISICYALLGGLWILCSGWLLHQFVKDGQLLSVMETIKGWCFVAVTAFLLWMALDRYFREIRSAARMLEESEMRLRQAASAGNVGLWDWDMRTNKVFYSAEWQRQIGYESGELSDDYHEWKDRLHPDDRERTLQRIQDLIENPSSRLNVEFRMRHKNGSYRWILAQASIIADEQGNPHRMLGSHLDITQRKEAEEARAGADAQLRQAQKMEALGTLAGGIAHDFNNILGVIIGYSEMALTETDDPVLVKQDLQGVLKGAERAKELVQQILAFSRGDEPVRKPVQVSLIVKEALKMLRASLPSTIEIKQDILSVALAMADPTQVHQVMMNLCTNAAHAMRQNGGVLDVSLTDVSFGPASPPPHRDLKDGSYVKLTVRDTGHGIDPSIIDRIFDPFFTTKGLGIGTGLGLSVVHGIIKSCDGVILVESVPGKGTAFTVFLPATGTAGEKPVDSSMSLPRGNEHILIVDDEPALAKITARLLESLGYNVEYCFSGADALDAVRAQGSTPFDMVITDMTMPRLTGVDLAKRLHDQNRDLAIILCTGFSDQIDIERAEGFGIHGFLSKPVVLKTLAALVRKVFDQRSQATKA